MAAAAATTAATAATWRERVLEDLIARTLPFWLAHSVDDEFGGFFNCLDDDGAVTETTKHVWLQGRQCWMLAKIANTFTDDALGALVAKYPAAAAAVAPPSRPTKAAVKALPLTRVALIEAARRGVDFLRAHAVDTATGHVWFALRRDGAPAAAQRKPFGATFMILALNEVAVATGDATLRAEALALLDRVLVWVRTPGALGRPILAGAADLSPLNVPMILLNVISELRPRAGMAVTASEGHGFYDETVSWCVAEIQRHIVRGGGADGRGITAVLESVTPGTGAPDYATADGRTINPGHVIEAGWFLLAQANDAGDADLRTTALEVIDWALEAGWDDAAHGGGIIYFRDAEGRSPRELGRSCQRACVRAGSSRRAPSPASPSMDCCCCFEAARPRGIPHDRACASPPTAAQLEWPMKLWWPHNEGMIALAMAYKVTGE